MKHKYPFFALLDRVRYIERWSLMRSNQRETVAEHTFQVCYLVHALYQIERMMHPDTEVKVDLGTLLARAIYHDSAEVLTGDLPTPIKYFNDELRQAYGVIEDAAEQSLLETLPKDLQVHYAEPMGIESVDDPAEEQQIKRWIKAADSLSAYLKCQEELRLGNDEFREAAESTKLKIRALNCPEADFFLEHFAPTYNGSLDELKRGFDALSEHPNGVISDPKQDESSEAREKV